MEIGAHPRSRTSIDLEVARIAAQRHSVIRLDQLVDLGLSASAVRSRVASGRLFRQHRGVFSAGHPKLSEAGRWLAAVDAAGPDATLSHWASAVLQCLRRFASAIDVSVPRHTGLVANGYRLHRVRPFHPEDVTEVAGIPCTTVARTILDLAPLVGRRGIELMIAEAQFRGTYRRGHLEALVERSLGQRGVRTLREVLADHGIESTLTNLELEERFLALTRKEGLPLPLVNERITAGGESLKCDFVWPDARLIAETDGRVPHIREHQFEEDRRRDAVLKLSGWEVIRFTWLQVVRQPGWVASVIRRVRQDRLR